MAEYRSRFPYYVAKKSLEENGRRYTQEEIAAETGLAQPTVSNWLNTEKPIDRITLSTVKVLADWVGCQWYELIEEVSDDTEYVATPAPSLLRATA